VLFKKQVAVVEVEAVLFISDNQHIAVATNDHKIKIFQLGNQDYKEILLITLPTSNPLCMVWSQTQNTLFVGDDLGALYSWNILVPGPSAHMIQ
jgi:WD40 repeat protein